MAFQQVGDEKACNKHLLSLQQCFLPFQIKNLDFNPKSKLLSFGLEFINLQLRALITSFLIKKTEHSGKDGGQWKMAHNQFLQPDMSSEIFVYLIYSHLLCQIEFIGF